MDIRTQRLIYLVAFLSGVGVAIAAVLPDPIKAGIVLGAAVNCGLIAIITTINIAVANICATLHKVAMYHVIRSVPEVHDD